MTRTIIKAICNGEDYYIETGAGQESPVVEFLLVGGGGGGGATYGPGGSPGGGGGGGGQVVYCEEFLVEDDSYNIVIGCGGAINSSYLGTNGGDSCFGNIVAVGGGAGGWHAAPTQAIGNSGGNGGGSTSNGTRGGCGCQHNGGAAAYGGGGGGGAGGDGCNGNSYCGGNGGAAYISSVSGIIDYYSGGGGGGAYHNCNSTYAGQGGCGGGRGGYVNGSAGNATKYGGGGGGANYCQGIPGAGCQGVFIMRYPATCGYQITGGCKYQCGIYCIHCFTCDGCVSVGSPLPTHNVSYVCGNFCAMRTGGTTSSGCGLRFYFTAVNDMCLKTFGNNVGGVNQNGTITDRDSGEILYTFPSQYYAEGPTFQTNLQLKSGHRYAISMGGWSGGGYSFDTFEFDGGTEGPLSNIIKDYSGDIVYSNTIIMCLEDIPRFT